MHADSSSVAIVQQAAVWSSRDCETVIKEPGLIPHQGGPIALQPVYCKGIGHTHSKDFMHSHTERLRSNSHKHSEILR